MNADSAYTELPAQCRAWDGFLLGDEPLNEARRCPDTWIPVVELTITEALQLTLGGQVRALRFPAQAIRYDSASGRYLAYPLALMPRAACLRVTHLDMWRDAWQPLIACVLRPLVTAASTTGERFAMASEYAGAVVREIRSHLKRKEQLPARIRVRAA